MLTIFSTCKPFVGHTAVIQRSAIVSWTLLRPRPEIILLGDDEGTSEIARELGLLHIPHVDRGASGRMLLSSLFQKAEDAASYDYMCYVNADTVLLSDFTQSLAVVFDRGRPGLVTGARRSVRVNEPIDFRDDNWDISLRKKATLHKQRWRALDYWVYPRNTFPPIPPMVHGPHPGCEGWAIFTARAMGIDVIDATASISSIHLDHDLPPVSVSRNSQSEINLRLCGGNDRIFYIADATHVLTEAGLQRALAPAYLYRRLYTLALFDEKYWPVRFALDGLLTLSRPVRRRFGWSM